MDANLNKPFMGIEFLASKTGMSKTKFKSYFKEFYGISPAIYHKKEKLNLAKKMLETKQYKSIKDLSDDLDYPTSYSFISLFKKEFGIPPQNIL